MPDKPDKNPDLPSRDVTMTENTALTFWYDPKEDVYSPDDGEPV